MTEEIIIDGVNVAGCEFLRHCVIPDNEGCKIDDSLCCDVGNCYYKQLKRLEFELKVTKADYEASEQENKELKKQIESQKGLITVGGKQQYEMTIAYGKCKSALEEIRVIADDTFKVCDDDCGNARKIKLIIDKINEVLN